MKIALIGGTGFVGSAVLTELLSRGHEVVALARSPAKYQVKPGLTVVKADVQKSHEVAAAVAGSEMIVNAYNPGWTVPAIYDEYLAGTQAIVDGVKRAGVPRLLTIGGAGSLFIAPGLQLVDTDGFPAEFKQGALAARDALTMFRSETTLDWTFLSPPVFLTPGERSGRYRLGGDDVLMDGDKPAGITVADLAVAVVDEVEDPKHSRNRFTVSY